MTTAKSIIRRLVIVDEDICTEAVNQVSLFVDAARYHVARMRIRTQAESALDVFAADRSLSIRARPREGERLTEGHIKSRLQKHPRFIRLQAELEKAKRVEAFSKLLLEAARMRKDAIKIIADARVFEGMKGSAEVERGESFRKLSQRARELHNRRVDLEEE